MKQNKFTAALSVATLLLASAALIASDTPHESSYAEVTRTVEVGDFDAMAATYHKDAILVTAQSSSPISEAIARWRVDGVKLAAEGSAATVAFRFSEHRHGETTALETGIFRYSITNRAGEETAYLVHFEDLLIKQNGNWLTMMERQMEDATQVEWDELTE
jgi:ketosteroid isomerase-like protein